MNEATCRKIVDERSNRMCERCGTAPADSKHHRLKRSHGGQWTPSNIVDLCGDGTTGCHGHIEHHADEARAAGFNLRTGQDPRAVSLRHGAWPDSRMFLDDDGMFAFDGEYIPERLRPWDGHDTVEAQRDEREYYRTNP